jgi:hypothetical protein
MSKDIFISYSRRDQEFVTRLASDLNAHVAGVWFDQSTIQAGQKWHAEIMEGIQDCKAFILVLSPDAVESRYVREEVHKALELGKTIFPVVYRPAQWTGEFESLVRDIQTLDLRSGSYTDEFQKLVDGLIEAGAGKASEERPFLRQPTKIGLNVVFSKIPGWAFAWGGGWLVFWIVALIVFAFLVDRGLGAFRGEDFRNFLVILISGVIGGFTGGLLAGLLTMFALRPNAPSISWKHMSPTIRIWGISGPLGIIASGLITALMIAVGALSAHGLSTPDCSSIGFRDCVGQIIGSAVAGFVITIILILGAFTLLVIAAWFLTGMFAGWQVVRHIRRLEPGITNKQGWEVSTSWGCGAIVAAVVMAFIVGILSKTLGL